MADNQTERFTDVEENPIPPQDTWDQLSVNQLIDVKNKLEERLWQFQKVPQVTVILRRSIAQISALIDKA